MLRKLRDYFQRKILAQSNSYKPFLTFEGIFSENECRNIIALAAEGELELGRVMTASGGGEKNTIIRKMKSRWMSRTENVEIARVFEKIEHIADVYNKKYYGFDIVPSLDRVLFNAYKSDDYYSWHQDFGPGPFSVRKLSLVIQLSKPEEYEGGELQFFSAHAGSDDKHYVVPKKQGSVTVFPAFEFHRVTPVLKGERYSLVCLILGPTFR